VIKLKQNALMLKEKTVEVIYFNTFLLRMLLTLAYSHKTFLLPHFSTKKSCINFFFYYLH